MAINTDLLIAAPMLQDYLVDKDSGFPLANGIVSLYKDTARSFYKNWYYQSGAPGAYTYIPLDNPLHLSSVGTIQDPNGNDVIPFYYPYQENDENIPEAYYITVYSVDENGAPAVLQFTRENFPFVGGGVSPESTSPTLRNYIVNNVYWRNIGTLNATNVLNQVIAPSQHDGYANNSDIRFIKSVAGAVDQISFIPITSVLNNDITPETMLNFTCDSVQVGETQKCIQYPVSLHVKTLQNVEASLVIQAQNVAGNANNFLDLYVYQFLGTGALSQPAPILIQRILLNNAMTKYVIPFIFPDAAGLTLGNGGDDALFIQVQYPLSAISAINHTKPSVYLSDEVPDNDFDTYDQINSIICDFRTADFRVSLNSFLFGWVATNDGTIGNSSSNATSVANVAAWPLYNLIWNAVGQTYAPMFTSAGASVAYGASAINDWNANNQLSLTKQLGRAMASIGTASGGTTNWALGQTTGTEGTNNVPAHTHPATLDSTGNPSTAGGNFITILGENNANHATSPGSVTVGENTGAATIPLYQPTSFGNMFLKL
jgi:hypothetical protein